MSLYTEWRNLSDNHESQEAEVKFWEAYLQAEASIYNELLNNKQEVIEGKVSELAAKYNVSVEYFMGFIDGISESLKEDITLETIEADSTIKLDIDFEKLYYNMVEVEAHWLYNLPGWETILPAAKRKELQKAYEESTGAPANCISIGGGTYCRYVKNTVSFGPVFPGQKELAHQSNEYISLDDLRKIAKIYAQAIYNLIE